MHTENTNKIQQNFVNSYRNHPYPPPLAPLLREIIACFHQTRQMSRFQTQFNDVIAQARRLESVEKYFVHFIYPYIDDYYSKSQPSAALQKTHAQLAVQQQPNLPPQEQ